MTMFRLASQTANTNTAKIVGVGFDTECTINRISIVKSSTTGEQIIVYMPFRSESAGASNRIIDWTFGRGAISEDFDPPLVKTKDMALFVTGTTNMTAIVYGNKP
jgi:hypothetical protein